MWNTRWKVAWMVLAVTASMWFFRNGGWWKPNAGTVLAGVQRLNELTTVRYTIQQVVAVEENATPVGSEAILLILQAGVQAGIDLADMREGDVIVRSDGAVVIRLPRAKILNAAVDEKATKVWDRKKTWWTPWVPYSLGLEQKARVEGLESVKKAALEMGILQQAEKNAETSIRELLGLAGIKKVEFVPAGTS